MILKLTISIDGADEGDMLEALELAVDEITTTSNHDPELLHMIRDSNDNVVGSWEYVS